MWICIHCDQKNRDFLDAVTMLTACGCCNIKRMCILILAEPDECK
jgi:hypothetical protein